MKRHIRNQHEEQSSYQCQYCEGVYKNESSLKDHCRNKHNIYQTSNNYWNIQFTEEVNKKSTQARPDGSFLQNKTTIANF